MRISGFSGFHILSKGRCWQDTAVGCPGSLKQLPKYLQELLLLLVSAIFLWIFYQALFHNHDFLGDSHPTYVAGRMLQERRLDAIYHRSLWVDQSNVHPLWDRELRVLKVQGGTTFVYSPAYLLLTYPLVTLLSVKAFASFILYINALSALIIGSESSRLAGVQTLSCRFIGGIGAALAFPVLYGAAAGQNTIPALALVLMAFRVLERGGMRSNFFALVLLLLGSTFKPWIALVFLLLPLMGQFRLFLALCGSYAVMGILLPKYLAPQLYHGYLDTLFALSKASLVAYNNYSFRGFLHRLSLEGWTSRVSIWWDLGFPPEWRIVELLGVGLYASLYIGLCLLMKPSRVVLLTTGLASIILPLGICWSHYFTMVIPLSCLVVFGRPFPWPVRSLGIVQMAQLFIPYHPLEPFPILLLPQKHISPTEATWWSVYYFAPTLLVAIMTILTVISDRRRQS